MVHRRHKIICSKGNAPLIVGKAIVNRYLTLVSTLIDFKDGSCFGGIVDDVAQLRYERILLPLPCHQGNQEGRGLDEFASPDPIQE